MKGAKELCLEDYVRFYNKEELALTLDQLSKIARINGFIKPSNINKSSTMNALRTVDLTPPGRSTVGECLLRSSTNAKLSLDEVMEDIVSLGWQECPIGSILTIGNDWAMESAAVTAPISSSCSSDQTKKKVRKGEESKGSGAKRKGKYVAALALPWIVPVERTTGSPSGSQV